MKKQWLATGVVTVMTAMALTGNCYADSYSSATPITAFVDIAATLPTPQLTFVSALTTSTIADGDLLGTITVGNRCTGCLWAVTLDASPRRLLAADKELRLEGSSAGDTSAAIPFDFYTKDGPLTNGMVDATGPSEMLIKARGASNLVLPGRYSKTMFVMYMHP